MIHTMQKFFIVKEQSTLKMFALMVFLEEQASNSMVEFVAMSVSMMMRDHEDRLALTVPKR